MTDRGIEMIDAIQGPPRWQGPDVLLRQTSFRALAETRALRTPDGSVTSGALRVRFGEVEARGIALTRRGRARYDDLITRLDEQAGRHPQADRAELAGALVGPSTSRTPNANWPSRAWPTSPTTSPPDRPRDGSRPPTDIGDLLRQGWVRTEPIVYEDFLPRSAAGIFQSNLSGEGSRNNAHEGTAYDSAWLSQAIGREVLDPFSLYEQQQNRSIAQVARELHLADGRD